MRKLRTQRDNQQWMLDLALNMRGRVQNFERDDKETPTRAHNYRMLPKTWRQKAEHDEALAKRAHKLGHHATACEHYDHAIEGYRMAQHPIFYDDHPVKTYLYNKMSEMVDRRSEVAPYPIERVEVPFGGGKTISCLLHLLPENLKPDPENLFHGSIYGAACMTLMLLTGVAGPLVDSYFLGGKLNRKQIVATKAICQIFGHGAKLLYFGGLIEQAATVDPWLVGSVVVASMVGTALAKPVLERLSDTHYRTWAKRIIATIACAYLVQGGYLMAASGL